MKIKFIESFSEIPYGELYPLSKEEHRGKVSRSKGSKGETLRIILPCGHNSMIDGWEITDIDSDTPSATPSIFCHGDDGKPCWHGYLTNGELKEC